METRENILKELQEIAPRLAKLEKKNFFTVPDGYFEGFKTSMLQQVSSHELTAVAPELLKVEKKNTADVPAGYFNTFSADLIKKIRANEAATELSAIAPTLAAAAKKNTLQVPANYFAEFPQHMMQRIAHQQKVSEPAAMPKWMLSLNAVLERFTVVLFKPKYSFAFAGMATVLIIAIMVLQPVEQIKPCTDLLCMEQKITDDELDAYLDSRIDVGNEVFELNSTEDIQSTESSMTDAMNMLSNEELGIESLD